MSLPLGAVLESFGEVLAYPRDGYRARVEECEDLLTVAGSPAATAVRSFSRATADLDETGIAELYTRTFDLNPVCTPEVGWHIYGEQYRRGRFLVQARDLLQAVGVEERGELPDHLMSLLPAIGRLDADDASRFAGTYLVPAVDKMLSGLEDKANPYEQILRAIQIVLRSFACEPDRPQGPFDDDDLVQLGTPHRQPTHKGVLS